MDLFVGVVPTIPYGVPRYMLPLESEALLSATSSLAEIAAKSSGEILGAVTALARPGGPILTRLPDDFDMKKLRDVLQIGSRFAPEKEKAKILLGLRAIDRFIPPDDKSAYGERYGRSLMRKGAEVMVGGEKMPDIIDDVSEVLVEGGRAAMTIPFGLWHMLYEQRHQIMTGAQEGLFDRMLGYSQHPLSLDVKAIPEPGETIGDNATIPTYDFKVARDPSGERVTISAGNPQVSTDDPDYDLVQERITASMLGLRWLLGQIEEARRDFTLHPLLHDLSALHGMADVEVGRLRIRHEDVTTVLRPTPHLRRLPVIPPAASDKKVREPQPTSHSVTLRYVPGAWINKLTRLGKNHRHFGFPWRGDPFYEQLGQLFLGGIDWSRPLLDVTSKLGKIISTDHYVVVTPTPPYFEGAQEHFALVGNQATLYLALFDQEDAERRYAILGSADASGTPHYDDYGRWNLILVFGPSGELAYRSAWGDITPRNMPYPVLTQHAISIDMWRRVQRTLPFRLPSPRRSVRRLPLGDQLVLRQG